jgi:crotonobetainyl-CoA:carnitine CoA-transferase CaiB-like acyl-CoA transferase
MMQFAVTGKPANPMPNRLSAWAVYDVFTVKDGEQIFLSAVSDTQWAILCKEFSFDDLKADPRLGSNNERVQNRSWLIPMLRERFAELSAKELSERFEKVGLPYAPITRPHELFDDPHLLATGGLAPMTIAADNTSSGKEIETRAALLPLALNGERLRIRNAPPRVGADTVELLISLGYSNDDINRFRDEGIIRSAESNTQ